jgi:hypothetical protein
MLEVTIIVYKHIPSLNQIEMELYHASLQLLLILLSAVMERELLQDPGTYSTVLYFQLSNTDSERNEKMCCLFHFCANCQIGACPRNSTDMYEHMIFEVFRVVSGRFWSSGL